MEERMKTRIGQFARGVSIIGVGVTPMGNVQKTQEIKDLTERELFAWAVMEAMEDAKIEAKDIDCLYLGQVFDESHSAQISTSGSMGRWAGLSEIPAFKHETACCTALSGLHHAAVTVASGMHDIVLSANVDINRSNVQRGNPPFMRNKSEFEDVLFDSNALGCDNAYWYPGGEIVAFLEGALVAYGKKYGFSIKELTDAMNHISMISRTNAVNNPLALLSEVDYKTEAEQSGYSSALDYLLSAEANPYVGAIMRFSHLTSVIDGAAALIVCPTEMAKKMVDNPVEIIGHGMSTSAGYYQTGSPMSFELEAFNQAYRMAGITDPYNEIDYMGIHDCCAQHYFTVTESAGYFKPGEGLHAAIEGRIAPDGDKPVNTSGGRLNMGHPIAGAAGIELAEAINQMRGKCEKRQMKKRPETAVIHGYGAGFHSTAAILRAI
jgi:acetyl-CoA C-acetyltransferase